MINGSTHAQLFAALGASWMSNIGDESNSESEPASSGGADTPAHGQFQGPTTSVAAYMFSTTVCVLPPQHRLAEVSPTSARNLQPTGNTSPTPHRGASLPATGGTGACPFTIRCKNVHQKVDMLILCLPQTSTSGTTHLPSL